MDLSVEAAVSRGNAVSHDDAVRTQAYYHWLNHTGEAWWDPVQNWLQAEEELSDDRHFFVDRHGYEENLLPVYSQRLEPQQLVQFPLELPFHVPFEHGFLSTRFEDDGSVTTLVFTKVPIREVVQVGTFTPRPITRDNYWTRVEMIYASDQRRQYRGEKETTEVFERLLEHLNCILRAYALLSKDSDIYLVTRGTLHFASIYRVVDLPEWKHDGLGLFLLNMPRPMKPILTREHHEEVIHYAMGIAREANPFVTTMELVLAALHEKDRGFRRDAVIHIQTSMETFLSTLLVQMLLLEGKTPAEAEAAVDEMSFMSTVKTQYHGRIGGRWDVNALDTPIGNWHRDTYLLRNRIIHAGYQPTESEAVHAIEAAIAFKDAVIQLVDRARCPYRSISKLLHKGEGLNWETQ